MASITFSKHWNNPRYQNSLLRLYAKTAGGAPHGWDKQPQMSLIGGMEKLAGQYAEEDVERKLAFQRGAQQHRAQMHGLDVRSRGYDIDKMRLKSQKKIADRQYRDTESEFYPRLGLGFGQMVYGKWSDKQEEKRKKERQAEVDLILQGLKGLGGNQ